MAQVAPMMSFGDAVKTCFKKYASFKGRARRSEFWWFYLAIYVVNSVLGSILFYFGSAKQALQEEALNNIGFDKLDQLQALADKEATYAHINLVLMILIAVWSLVTLIPILAAWCRRLHDVGKSGHYLWLGLLCGVGGLIPLIMAIGDSQPHPNAYGPSPKYVE